MKSRLTLGLPLLIATATLVQTHPKQRWAADSATAVKIAQALLVPVYGKKQIESEQSFTANLEDGVETVSGTLPCRTAGGTTSACDGGIAVVEISKTVPSYGVLQIMSPQYS